MLDGKLVDKMIQLALSPDAVWRSLMDLLEGKRFDSYPMCLMQPGAEMEHDSLPRKELLRNFEIQRSCE